MSIQAVVLNLGLVPLARWHKNGDHPHDDVGKMEPDPSSAADASGEVGTYRRQEGRIVRYFRRPWDAPTGSRIICARCGYETERHGWIDSGGAGRTVCPGDYVVVADQPADCYAISKELADLMAPGELPVLIRRAAEACEGVGANVQVGDDSALAGLAEAARVTMERARELSEQEG